MAMTRAMRSNRAARRRYERRWATQNDWGDAIILMMGGLGLTLFFAVALWARWPEILLEYLLT